MRNLCLLGILGVFFIASSSMAGSTDCYEPAPAPTYQLGEKWVWRDSRQVEQRQEVITAQGDLTGIAWREPFTGGDDRGVSFFDADRVIQRVDRPKSRLVPHRDSEAVVSVGKKVLDFPLRVGKTWDYEYMVMPRHSGGKVTYQNKSRVLACEQVSTPAGKFSAFKIEVEQSSPSFRSIGVYHLWYAPEVKNFVKRHFVPSDWWSGGVWTDNDLVRLEIK